MKRNKLPPAATRPPGALGPATVIGLGGVGRQVARQLVALGVPRLLLMDSAIVNRATYAVQGYAYDDVGRPRVHTAAQQCHQLNPRLEIHTVPKRSVRGLDLGDAVFCCPASARVWQSLARVTGSPDVFLARCCVQGALVQIDIRCRRASGAFRAEGPGNSEDATRRQRRTGSRVCTVAVAAGLMVAQFVRYLAGSRPVRSIRFQVDKLTLDTEEPS